MVGKSGDGSANPDGSRQGLPEEAETDSSPVLDGVSEDELDAIVSKLRTDKRRTLAPAAQSRSRGEMMSERLHRGRTLVSAMPTAPREVQSHAWYVALGGQTSGPHDAAALKAFWEKGELGPESLCWREGFNAWLPVSQVPELAGTLAPRPEEKVPEAAPVPVEASAQGPGLGLKGLAGLRTLTERFTEAPPASVVSPEPKSKPAAAAPPQPDGLTEPHVPVFAQPPAEGVSPVQARGGSSPDAGTSASGAGTPGASSPDASTPASGAGTPGASSPEAGTSASAAGTQAVLAGEQTPRRERSRWRGAVWLTAAGGVVGGVTVAVAMGLLGYVDVRGLAGRMGFREDAPAVESSAPGASPANTEGLSPATEGQGALARNATPAAEAPAPPAGTGLAASVASGAGAASGTAPLGGVGIDRGGSVPSMSVARAEASARASRESGPSLSGTMTTESPAFYEEDAPAMSTSALDKRANALPVDRSAAGAPPEAPAVPAAPAAPKSDIGPDEDYERELLEPPPGAGARPERTVYVPPDPSKPPALLERADVFAVVAANKDDIAACAAGEHPARVGTGGRVVVRWTILPSGRVEDVVTESPSVKGTPLARCIEDKVRALRFPRHQEQSGQVRFPFVF